MVELVDKETNEVVASGTVEKVAAEAVRLDRESHAERKRRLDENPDTPEEDLAVPTYSLRGADREQTRVYGEAYREAAGLDEG